MPEKFGHRAKYQSLWVDMACRKKQFHANEDWRSLRLWGLVNWKDVKPLLDSGELLTHMEERNKTIWVWPSEETYHTHIEPLLEKSLDELANIVFG